MDYVIVIGIAVPLFAMLWGICIFVLHSLYKIMKDEW